ncbi:MAG: L,D-transpeptidase [Pseudomonadota bacterium]|nr:L,D-transpeptidase [Pseudomonadota bacterium]
MAAPTFAQPATPSEPPGEASGPAGDVLAAQILLDRARHSPGAIDGQMGSNTARAIRAWQREQGLAADGRPSPALVERLRSAQSGELLQRYRITEEDVAGPFVDVPEDMSAMEGMAALAYESPAEKLAEKFHMSQSFLISLNPGADFSRAGTEIRVANVGRDELDRVVTRIEVDKAAAALRAFNKDGKLVATYPATVGSAVFPSPSGAMEVKAVAYEPKYYFDPANSDWGPDRKLTIAAGPNNPVGSTWIDLSKDGYGIHGTPDPALIGKTASHGCVRLTNWDAAELATAVSPSTKVEFVS